jgi:hypothetical protein
VTDGLAVIGDFTINLPQADLTLAVSGRSRA